MPTPQVNEQGSSTNSSAPNVASSLGNFQPYAAGILSLVGNLSSSYLQHKHQLEYMNKAQQQAIERWNKENEYNLPSNVKQRLIDAGLNPNLMYGSSGSAGGVAGSLSGGSSPEAFSQNPFEGVLSSIFQAKENKLRLQQMENEVRSSRANADLAEVHADDAKKESAARQQEYELDEVPSYVLDTDEDGLLVTVYNHNKYNYYTEKAHSEVSNFHYGRQRAYNDAISSQHDATRKDWNMRNLIEETEINMNLLREQLRHIKEDNQLSEQEKRNKITASLNDVLNGLLAKRHLIYDPATKTYSLSEAYGTYSDVMSIVTDILEALGLGTSLTKGILSLFSHR